MGTSGTHTFTTGKGSAQTSITLYTHWDSYQSHAAFQMHKAIALLPKAKGGLACAYVAANHEQAEIVPEDSISSNFEYKITMPYPTLDKEPETLLPWLDVKEDKSYDGDFHCEYFGPLHEWVNKWRRQANDAEPYCRELSAIVILDLNQQSSQLYTVPNAAQYIYKQLGTLTDWLDKFPPDMGNLVHGLKRVQALNEQLQAQIATVSPIEDDLIEFDKVDRLVNTAIRLHAEKLITHKS